MFANVPVPFSIFSSYSEKDFISHSMSSFLKACFSKHSNDIVCTSSKNKDIMIISFPSDMASINSVKNVLNSNNDMKGDVVSILHEPSMKTSMKWKVRLNN